MPKKSVNLSPEQVITRVLEFADNILERAIVENNHKSVCKERCEYCCHQPVFVTPLEALAVSLAVEKMSPEDRSRLEQRISAYLKTLQNTPHMEEGVDSTRLDLCELGSGPTPEQFKALYGPACPFLEDGLCSIYESRPLMCREHTSLDDPEKCRKDEPFFGLPAALINEVPAGFCRDFVPDEMLFMPVWEYATSAEAALELPAIEEGFLNQVLCWKAQALGLTI